MWAVTFTPQGKMQPRTLMNGSLIIKDNWFFDRIWTVMDGTEMNAVETIDSGTLEFRHPEGDLALNAQLEANRGEQKSISPHGWKSTNRSNLTSAPHTLHSIP